MTSSQARVELYVDVFEMAGQKALALSDLKPSQLIRAVLEEFRSLEYLGDEPGDYTLVKAGGGDPLDEAAPLARQVRDGDRLVLVERELPLPPEARRPPQPIYLREPHEDKTYAVQWLPAIIGRRSEHQAHDDLVAVDLRAFTTGLRVSRRHVRMTEEGGCFYIENLSSNPVSLICPGRPGPIPVTAERRPLAAGDVIRLDRSDLELKFIVRPTAAAPAAGAEAAGLPDKAAPQEEAEEA